MTDKFYSDEKLFFPGVGSVTRNLLEAVFYNEPLTAEAIADFGLESREHYQALRYAIQVTDVHPMEIDAMAGDGAKLTAWLNDTGYNRKDLVFHTARDVVVERNELEEQRIEPPDEAKSKRRQKYHERDKEPER